MADSRYRITERVAAGGMAEVFRGVAESMRGFKKNIAIKRILPSLTKNKKFVAMFLDEARLSLAPPARQHRAGVRHRAHRRHVLHRHGVRRRRRPQGAARMAPPDQPPRPDRARPLHHPRDLQGPRLRARGPQPRDRRADGHRPPRHLAAQRAHLEAGRGEGRGLRPRQGDEPGRDHRPRRGQGQDELPVARGGARRGGRRTARTSSRSASCSTSS